jgi:hypothetical protein
LKPCRTPIPTRPTPCAMLLSFINLPTPHIILFFFILWSLKLITSVWANLIDSSLTCQFLFIIYYLLYYIHYYYYFSLTRACHYCVSPESKSSSLLLSFGYLVWLILQAHVIHPYYSICKWVLVQYRMKKMPPPQKKKNLEN